MSTYLSSTWTSYSCFSDFCVPRKREPARRKDEEMFGTACVTRASVTTAHSPDGPSWNEIAVVPECLRSHNASNRRLATAMALESLERRAGRPGPEHPTSLISASKTSPTSAPRRTPSHRIASWETPDGERHQRHLGRHGRVEASTARPRPDRPSRSSQHDVRTEQSLNGHLSRDSRADRTDARTFAKGHSVRLAVQAFPLASRSRAGKRKRRKKKGRRRRRRRRRGRRLNDSSTVQATSGRRRVTKPAPCPDGEKQSNVQR